jgi:hypothetical protein
MTDATGEGRPLAFDADDAIAVDGRATSEAVAFAEGVDLEKDGKQREHDRHQSFRDTANAAILWLFRLIAVCLGLGILVYTFHLLCPRSWHFLDKEALDKLQTVMGAAVLSSALTSYVKNRLS